MGPTSLEEGETAWVQVVTAVLGSGGAGAIALKLAARWLELRRNRQARVSFDAIAEVVFTLQTLRHSLGAARVVLVRAWPRSGSSGEPQRSSVLYESTHSGVPLVYHRWQGVEATDDYARILSDLERCSVADVRLEDLDEGSPLRNLYSSEGIQQSRVRRVARSREALFFVSANLQHGEPSSPAEEDHLRVAVDRLERQLRRCPEWFGRLLT